MDLTTKDLQLIREALLRNFSLTDLEKSGRLDDPPTQELWKQLAEIDLEFFAGFYLPNHFDCAPAPLHKETYRTMEQAISSPGKINNALVWPRGFGKTTTTTLALPLWCICFRKRRFIPIISDSHTQAKQQLATIKDEIEHNDRIKEDFGELQGAKWQEDDITTANRVKLIALGARMKIRGRKFLQYRPDLIIVDDSENLEGVQSATRREAHRKWFWRSVMNAGWSDTKVFVVGNFLHFDCLLQHLVDNPMFHSRVYQAVPAWAEREDLWEHWRGLVTNLTDKNKEKTAYAYFLAHKEEMLKGAVSAWPEAFSYYDLMLTRVAGGEAAFATELQNEPVDPKSRLFKKWETFRMEYRSASAGLAEGIWLIPSNGQVAVPLSACTIFGFTDPSMGGSVQSDYSAITLIAKAPTRQMFAIVSDIERRPPDRLINAQNKWAKEYPIARWRIEKNAFQALFATESARRSMEEGVYLPVEPYNQLSNKQMRINSLQPDLENGYLMILENGQSLLKKELREWPMGAYDDGLDSLEGCRTLAKSFESQISTELIQAKAHEFAPNQAPGADIRIPLGTDPFAKYDKMADKTIYDLQVAAARKQATAEGRDPDVAQEEIPVPVEIFVPMMFA